MTALAEVRTGIKDALEARLTGVNIYPAPPKQITAPAVVVAGFQITEQATRQWSKQVEMWVFVSSRDTSMMDELDAMVDPESSDGIHAALYSSELVVRVAGVDEYRIEEAAGTPYFACTVRLEIY